MSSSGSTPFLQRCQSSRWFGLIALFTQALFTASFAAHAAPIPSDGPSYYPSWWFAREVVKRVDPTNANPSWNSGSYKNPEDYAVANLGQLKQIAIAAYDELNAHLPGGAGPDLDALVQNWVQVDVQGNRQPLITSKTDDFAAANLGQLKAIAKVFYDRLIAAHYIGAYPWTGVNADDFSVANLGQVKYLFSFDLTYDGNGDGIPDWWEIAAGLNPDDSGAASSTIPNTSIVINGSTPTFSGAYQAGIDPTIAGSNSSGKPPAKPSNPLAEWPTTTYTGIDVSSSVTSEDIVKVAIDDTNQIGFMWKMGDGGVSTATFHNGQSGSVKTFPSSADPVSFTWDEPAGSGQTFSVTGSFDCYRGYSSCDSQGNVVGDSFYMPGALVGPYPPVLSRLFFATDSGSYTEFWPGKNGSGNSFGDLGYIGYYYYGFEFASITVNLGNSGLMVGSAETFDQATNMYDLASATYFTILGGTANYFTTPAYSASVFSPSGTSAGSTWSGSGDLLTPPQAAVCTGFTPVSIGTFIPLAVNDNGTVLGDDPSAPDSTNSLSVATTLSTRLLSSYLPPQYQAVVRFPRPVYGVGDAIPASEAWINNNGDIIVNAQIAVGDPGHKNWVTRTILWRNALSNASVPSFVIFSDPTIGRSQFNGNAVFAGTAYNPGGDYVAAAALIPTQFQEEYPSSGFDGVSQPPWLMVPVNGSNQAEAITAAAPASPISFSVQPSSTATIVQPTSTNDSPETITVSSSEISNNLRVQVGLGGGAAIDPVNTGLGIDVKPLKMVSVAIHAVTQHYTTPMVLKPGMKGTVGAVCVSGSHVLNTTPVAPDTYGPDGSLTIVTGGADGVCHTPAAAGDTQVIPVGQAIPADIAPANAPTAAELQTHLNQVYGPQANVYFTVTRSDFVCNYDVMSPVNGILDVSEGRATRPSSEQAAIEDHASGGVTFNVFYVKDFQGLPSSPGGAANHNFIGIAFYGRHITYVRDFTGSSVVVNCTAHEIGHLLDLGHTDRDYLPDGKANPASLKNVPDRSPGDRLMSPENSGLNTLLIKPEWDIINPNSPQTP